MEKYLIKRNAEVAEANINNIEENYIAPLRTLAFAIKTLAIGDVTKDHLRDAIDNDAHEIQRLFNETHKTDGMDERLAKVASDVDNDKLKRLYDAIAPFKSSMKTVYTGIQVGSTELLEIVDIDETGMPYLKDEIKDIIFEGAKEFATTQNGKDLFDLHHKIAKELQVLYNGMVEIHNKPGQSLSFDGKTALLYFPLGLFDIRANDDGNLVINPRSINFDPVVEDDEDFFDESDDE